MPYATRQGTIDFPKRKAILSKKRENSEKLIKTEESEILSNASSDVRKAFHDSSLGITGRKEELKQLSEFLLNHLKNETSGSMYISGLPGTGKTVSVNYVIESCALSKKYQIVKINCTSFNSSKAVFKRICEGLNLKGIYKTEKESILVIERYLLRKHKIILLILDEIDQLESKSQSVLYKIFEWPSWKGSKFVLIGIANAMDLTDRNLPRLCSKIELKPVLLHFAPYSKNEITEILKSRLTEANADKIFAPGAIELIAAKVAGTSGDIRRALDLGKRVVELAEQKKQQLIDPESNNVEKNKTDSLRSLKRKMRENLYAETPSKLQSLVDDLFQSTNSPENTAEVSPSKKFKSKSNNRVCLGEITPLKYNSSTICSPKSPLLSPKNSDCQSEAENFQKKSLVFKKTPVKTLKEDMALRRSPRKLQFDVDSKDVLSVVKSVFASSKTLNHSDESSFPLHQKLLICTLLLIIKKGKKKDLNIGKLHQVYSKVCSKRGITAVDKSGFLFLCRQVEVSGVLLLGKGPGLLAKVALQWDESEVVNALKDLNMMSSILNDSTCLN